MRAMMIGALAAVMAFAAPMSAQAQRGDRFAGTWAFQTQNLEASDLVHTVTGSAVIRRSGRVYSVRLVAHDYAGVPGGEERIVTAHQTCRGEVDADQLTITCQLVEQMETYSPDNFVLQITEPGVMTGVLVSASSAQVTWTRVRN